MQPSRLWSSLLPKGSRRRKEDKRRRKAYQPQVESLEDRRMMVSDLSVTNFRAVNDQLQAVYDVATSNATAFDIKVYQSSDGTSLDTLIGTTRVTAAPDLSVGTGHTANIAVSFTDSELNYRLVVKIDASAEVTESNESNNQLGFEGGIFKAVDGTVHVHGTDSADTAGVVLNTTLNVTLGATTRSFTAAGVPEVHFRLHDGNDTQTVGGTVNTPILSIGGAGNDSLAGGGGIDKLYGGAGSDTLSGGGSQNYYYGEAGFDSPEVWDNGDAEYSQVGTWTAITTVGFNKNQRVRSAGNGSNTATWATTGLTADAYEVFITWKEGTAATNAPFQVLTGATVLGTYSVNQNNAPSGSSVAGRPWHRLGQFEPVSGALSVKLTDNANGTVVADAVRLIAHTKPSTSGLADTTVLPSASPSVINLATAFTDTDTAAGGSLTYSITANDNTGLVSTGISGGNLTLTYTASQIGVAHLTVRATNSVTGLYVETPLLVKVDTAPVELAAVPRTLAYAGSEQAINTYTTGSQSYPAVAADEDGNYVVVWAGIGTGGVDGIYGQRYSSDGTAAGSQFQIDDDPGSYPTVGMDADGNFGVVWNNSTGQIMSRRYNAAGVAQNSPTLSISTTNSWQPTLAANPDGSGVLGWKSGSNYAARRLDTSGSPVGDVVQVTAWTSGFNVQRGSLALAADGSFVATWYNTAFSNLHARRFNASGEAITDPILVSTGNYLTGADVAIDSEGNFAVGWLHYDGSGQQQVMLRRYESDGTAITSATSLTSLGGLSGASTTRARFSQDDDLLVAWSDSTSGHLGIYSVTYGSDDVELDGVQRLSSYSTSGATFDLPALATTPDGFVAVWTSSPQDGASGGIFGQRLAIEPAEAAGVPDQTMNEDAAPLEIDLDEHFVDADIASRGDDLTYTVVANDHTDRVTTSISGAELTLTPVANQYGTATITVRATDTIGRWVESTFTVTVNSVNDTPTVSSAFSDVEADEDDATDEINLAPHFSDIESGTLTYSASFDGPEGLVDLSIDGSTLTIDYFADQNGEGEVTIRATDAGGLWVEDVFTLTVSAVNDTPTVVDSLDDVEVDEDHVDQEIDLADYFADVETANLTYSASFDGPEGLIDLPITGSTLTSSYFTDQHGEGDVIIRATDASGAWAEDVFHMTVNAVNDVPFLITPLDDVEVDENADDVEIDLAEFFDDVDLLTSGDTQTFSIFANTNDELVGASIDDGILMLSFAESMYGAATITIRAADLLNAIAEDSFTVTVNPANHAPVLQAIGAKTVESGTPLTFTAQATDSDVPAQSITYSLDANSLTGATINPSTGAFSWTPAAGFIPGIYQLVVRATDNGSPTQSDSETISVTVTAPFEEGLDLVGDGWQFVPSEDALGGGLRMAAASTGVAARWTFPSLSAGAYEVLVSWPALAQAATNVTATITNGIATLGSSILNQTEWPTGNLTDGVYWQSLGVFDAAAGSLLVELGQAASGILLADAVRIVRMPRVSFSQASSSSYSSVPINVTLSEPSPKTVTVDYQFVMDELTTGTGIGTDLGYGTLTFAPGITSRQIALPAIFDSYEGNESLHLRLMNASNSALGTQVDHVFTRLATSPVISAWINIDRPWLNTAPYDSDQMYDTAITLSAASPTPVTVDYEFGAAYGSTFLVERWTPVDGNPPTGTYAALPASGSIEFVPYETSYGVRVRTLVPMDGENGSGIEVTLQNASDPAGQPVTIDLTPYSTKGEDDPATHVDLQYSLYGGSGDNFTNGFTIRAFQPENPTYGNFSPFSNHQQTTVTFHVSENALVMQDKYFTAAGELLVRGADNGVRANDTDLAGSVHVVDSVKHGTLNLQANGSFTYQPVAGFEGIDSFTYRAQAVGSTATVTILVGALGLPAPPELNVFWKEYNPEDHYAVTAEGELHIAAAAGILGNDRASLTHPPRIYSYPTQFGNFTLNSDGSFDYVPRPGFVGTDTIQYFTGPSETPITVDYHVEGTGVQHDGTNYASADYELIQVGVGPVYTSSGSVVLSERYPSAQFEIVYREDWVESPRRSVNVIIDSVSGPAIVGDVSTMNGMLPDYYSISPYDYAERFRAVGPPVIYGTEESVTFDLHRVSSVTTGSGEVFDYTFPGTVKAGSNTVGRLEQGETTVSVTLSGAAIKAAGGFTFVPDDPEEVYAAWGPINIAQTFTVRDVVRAEVVNLPSIVDENVGSVEFGVQLVGPSAGATATTVPLSADMYFPGLPDQLDFAVGETYKSVTIEIPNSSESYTSNILHITAGTDVAQMQVVDHDMPLVPTGVTISNAAVVAESRLTTTRNVAPGVDIDLLTGAQIFTHRVGEHELIFNSHASHDTWIEYDIQYTGLDPQHVVIAAGGKETGRYTYEIKAAVSDANDVSHEIQPVLVDYNYVNNNDSEFGRNWSLRELGRLVADDGGLLYVRGDSVALWYESDGEGGFNAPASDYSTLEAGTWDDDPAFVLTTKVGEKLYFDQTWGLLRERREAGDKRTRYNYWDGDGDGRPDDLRTIVDRYGRTTRFDYEAGKVHAIVDFAGRTTRLMDLGGSKDSIRDPDPDGNGLLTAPITKFKYFGQHAVVDASGRSDIYLSANVDPAWYPRTTPLFESASGAALQGAWQEHSTTSPGTTYYAMDRFGNIVEERDALGNVTLYQRDEDGLVTLETHPDPDGPSGPLGAYVLSNFSYDRGHLTGVTLPGGLTREWAYDPDFGQLTRYRDGFGRETRYDINDDGMIAKKADVVGSFDDWSTSGDDVVTSYTYFAGDASQVETIVSPDPDGTSGPLQSATTRYEYYVTTDNELGHDRAGRLKSTTEAYGTALAAARTFDYDQYGNQLSITVPLPLGEGQGEGGSGEGVWSTTLYEYDALDRLIKITEPDPDTGLPTGAGAPTTRYTYDPAGRLLITTDALGNVTTNYYNAAGLVSMELSPDPDGAGPLGMQFVAHQYDSMLRPLSSKDRLGIGTVYTYDTIGRVETKTESATGETAYEYDNLNRVKKETRPLGRVTDFVYDAAGSLWKTIDAAPGTGDHGAVTTTFEYFFPLPSTGEGQGEGEGEGQGEGHYFERTIDGRGAITERHFDDLGRLVDVYGADPVTGQARDSNGDPLGPHTQYVYDNAGRQTHVITRVKDTEYRDTEYRYDTRNRLTDVITPDPDGPYVSPTEGNLVAGHTHYAYDSVGNQISVTTAYGTSSAATTDYIYDRQNRRIEERQPNPTTGIATNPSSTEHETLGPHIHTTYDLVGNVLSITSPLPPGEGQGEGAPVTKYRYDNLHRLIRTIEADPDGPTTLVGTEYTNLQLSPESLTQYDTFGRLQFAIDANRSFTEYRYDDKGRVQYVLQMDPDGAGPLKRQAVHNFYDDLGRVTTEYRSTLNSVPGSSTVTGEQATWTATYEYDNLERRISRFTAFDGLTTEYHYDERNNLTSEVAVVSASDERETKYTYDKLSRNTIVEGPVLTDGTRPKTEQVFDLVGQVEELRETTRVDVTGGVNTPHVRVTNYEYDKWGQLVETIGPADENDTRPSTKNRYDQAGNVAAVTDPLGRETTYAHDKLDRNTAIVLPDTAQYTSTTINKNWNDDSTLHEVITPVPTGTRTTTHNYDNLRQHIGSTLPTVNGIASTEKTSFDRVRRVQSSIDRMGNKSTYKYDGLGQPTKYFAPDDPNSPAEEKRYDSAGNLALVIDALGNQTSYDYDLAQRLVAIHQPNPADGTPTGPETRRYYDRLGNLRFEFDGENVPNAADLTYANGDVTYTPGEGREDIKPTELRYDKLGRVERVIDPNGDATIFTYDLLGRRTSVTDANGNVTTTFYDDLNRVIREETTLGNRTFEYDLVGNQTRTVNRNGQIRRFEHNERNQLENEYWFVDAAQETAAGSTIADNEAEYFIHYGYDVAGRLQSVQDNSSHYVYEYDVLDRLTTTHDQNNANYEVRLDQGYVRPNSTPRNDDLRSTLSATLQTTTLFTNSYTYDPRLRLHEIEQRDESPDYGVQRKRLVFDYDDNDRLQFVTRYTGDAEASAADFLVGTSDYDYDHLDRLTSLVHHGRTQNGWNIAYTWDYDDAHRLEHASYDGPGTAHDENITYTYDERGQLDTTTYANDTLRDEDYDYDPTGNRTRAEGEAFDASGQDYGTPGAYNSLTSDGVFTYEYDNEGRRTARQRISTDPASDYRVKYGWDIKGRLTEVLFKNNSGTVTKRVTNTYDVYDQWIGTEVDSDGDTGSEPTDSTRFVYDRGQILLELDGDASEFGLKHSYLWGSQVDQLLADEKFDPTDPFDPSELSWALMDNQGSVRDLALVDFENLEEPDYDRLVGHADYDAYGNRFAVEGALTALLIGWTGRPFSFDTGLQFNNARWYEALVGAWISPDPIGFAGGYTKLDVYVGNSPTNATDPSGLMEPLSPATIDISGKDIPPLDYPVVRGEFFFPLTPIVSSEHPWSLRVPAQPLLPDLDITLQQARAHYEYRYVMSKFDTPANRSAFANDYRSSSQKRKAELYYKLQHTDMRVYQRVDAIDEIFAIQEAEYTSRMSANELMWYNLTVPRLQPGLGGTTGLEQLLMISLGAAGTFRVPAAVPNRVGPKVEYAWGQRLAPLPSGRIGELNPGANLAVSPAEWEAIRRNLTEPIWVSQSQVDSQLASRVGTRIFTTADRQLVSQVDTITSVRSAGSSVASVATNGANSLDYVLVGAATPTLLSLT